jgi:hypothetical protein
VQLLMGKFFPCDQREEGDCDFRPIFLALALGQLLGAVLLLRHAVRECMPAPRRIVGSGVFVR